MANEIVGIVLDDETELSLKRIGKTFAVIEDDRAQPGYLVFASDTWLEKEFGIVEPTGAIGKYVHYMQHEPRVGFHVYQVVPDHGFSKKSRSKYDEDDRVTYYTGHRVKAVIKITS